MEDDKNIKETQSNMEDDKKILIEEKVENNNIIENNNGNNDKKRKETESENENENKKPKRTTKRRLALIIGYLGADYHGFQYQTNEIATIEKELQIAMLKTNVFPEGKSTLLQINWQKASRTDTGVSALSQICSLQGVMENGEEEKLKDELNNNLPKNIRIWDVKTMTKRFQAQKQCEYRNYEYLCPVYVFQQGENNENNNNEEYLKELSLRVNKLLSNYVGTHKFHNFTNKLNSVDPSAKRYIKSFQCDPPLKLGEMWFLPLKVSGQSFLLHQIRKMVALTIIVMRTGNDALFNKILRGAESAHHFRIPKAPGFPLILLSCHYDDYNKKFGDRNKSLEVDVNSPPIKQFKEDFVYNNILSQEKGEKGFKKWLIDFNEECCTDSKLVNSLLNFHLEPPEISVTVAQQKKNQNSRNKKVREERNNERAEKKNAKKEMNQDTKPNDQIIENNNNDIDSNPIKEENK